MNSPMTSRITPLCGGDGFNPSLIRITFNIEPGRKQKVIPFAVTGNQDLGAFVVRFVIGESDLGVEFFLERAHDVRVDVLRPGQKYEFFALEIGDRLRSARNVERKHQNRSSDQGQPRGI